MKELKQYQCETCNTIYKSEAECKTCEKTHCYCTDLVFENFNGYKNGGEYPKKIKRLAEVSER